jgi:hypothetical protein
MSPIVSAWLWYVNSGELRDEEFVREAAVMQGS